MRRMRRRLQNNTIFDWLESKAYKMHVRVLLSKYRITQVHRYRLPWPPDPDSPPGMPRGLIEAVVEAPGGRQQPDVRHLLQVLERLAAGEATVMQLADILEESVAEAKSSSEAFCW